MCNLANKKEIVSIFSGIDVLGLGFADKFKVVLSVEKEKMACETLKANKEKFHKDMTVINKDIFSISDEEILKYSGVTGLIGGAPCQPFSNAKPTFDPSDERINCLFEYLRWVRLIKPDFTVLENTDALTQEKKIYLLNSFVKQLKELGYKVKYKVLDSHGYGNPQKRKRVFVVGVRNDIEEDYIFPKEVSSDKKKYVRDIIIPGEDKGECLSYDTKRAYISSFVPQGGNWRNLPNEELKEMALLGNYALDKRKGGMTGVYRRLNLEGHIPCPTLVTSPLQRNTMCIHPLEDRPLSVKEYKRAQGIPNDYKVLGSVANKYKFIGNAVPFELAKAVSDSIYNCLGYGIEKEEEENISIDTNTKSSSEEITFNFNKAFQLKFEF